MYKLIDITKVYRDGANTQLHALDNVSVELPKCGMVFVTGKSGCGKSTLLNILGGIERPLVDRLSWMV
jgi:ABC-type lipoprotein export system ATPase subunit